MEHKEHFHGSDLEKIEQMYHIKKEDIISFSSNVNPLGISPLMKQEMVKKIDCITAYPDREYTSLKKSIADYAGCSSNHIIVGNGSSELISILIKILKPKKALILAPTYSEYERELQLNQCETSYYALHESLDFHLDIADFKKELQNQYDFLVICNPNNPTSTTILTADIANILDTAKEYGIFVMIDETYIEFTDDIAAYSSVALTKTFDNVAVLRGTSKFFASPGLRLGYGITSNTFLLDEINFKKNPWMIHSLAVVAGEVMFSDNEYISKTNNYIQAERKRIYDIFKNISDVKAYEPTANFILIRFLNPKASAFDLFHFLICKNIMIRNCKTFPFLDESYFRFCFLEKNQNDLLIYEIKHYIESIAIS